MLDREEYIEQAYLFRSFGERITAGIAAQEALVAIGQEVLATSKLPMALDYLAGELRLVGTLSSAMVRLRHYFTPFQTFVIATAEEEGGRFDMRTALAMLEREATYRAESATPQGLSWKLATLPTSADSSAASSSDDSVDAHAARPITSEVVTSMRRVVMPPESATCVPRWQNDGSRTSIREVDRDRPAGVRSDRSCRREPPRSHDDPLARAWVSSLVGGDRNHVEHAERGRDRLPRGEGLEDVVEGSVREHRGPRRSGNGMPPVAEPRGRSRSDEGRSRRR